MRRLMRIVFGVIAGGATVLAAGVCLFAAYVFQAQSHTDLPAVQATDGIVMLTGGEATRIVCAGSR